MIGPAAPQNKQEIWLSGETVLFFCFCFCGPDLVWHIARRVFAVRGSIRSAVVPSSLSHINKKKLEEGKEEEEDEDEGKANEEHLVNDNAD